MLEEVESPSEDVDDELLSAEALDSQFVPVSHEALASAVAEASPPPLDSAVALEEAEASQTTHDTAQASAVEAA